MVADVLNDGGVGTDEPLYPLPPESEMYLLKEVHEFAREAKEEKNERKLTTAINRALQFPGFRDHLLAIKITQLNGSTQCWNVLKAMMYWFLAKRQFVHVSLLLWGPSMFSPEPRSVRLIWQALEDFVNINIMGASSQGKSYSPAVYLLLEWVMDPLNTKVVLISTKMERVKRELFSKICSLHAQSLITLPGRADTESITCDKKMGLGIFIEVASGAGAKGMKRDKRAVPHPLFGEMNRLFILVDEAQNIPVEFFDIVTNVMTGVGSDKRTGKLIMCANPSEQFSQYGINCEPENGWEEGANKTDVWISKTGWRVVRLNATKSENYLEEREVFKGFFTMKDYKIALRAHNGDVDAPGMWTYVYGMFPPTGDRSCIISTSLVDKSKREWIFEGPTENWTSNDPAITGDDCTMAFGRTGRASSYRTDDGRVVSVGKLRYVLQIDGIVVLPHHGSAFTVEIANDLMDRCQLLRVVPSHLAVDATGNTGVADNCSAYWNRRVLKVKENDPKYNEKVQITRITFSERASEVTVLAEDTVVPRDCYRNTATELWYAAAKWLEADVIGIGRNVDDECLRELTSRRGTSSDKSKKAKVEGKDDYKARGNRSPDRADAFVMLIHCVRLNSPWKPGLQQDGKNESVDDPLPPGAPSMASGGLQWGNSFKLDGFGVNIPSVFTQERDN